MTNGGSSIQAAIDAAADGDTVLVEPGVFSGPGNVELDFEGKAIVLLGEQGASATVIDCARAGRALHLSSGEPSSAVVQGFTFRNGAAIQRGGAIALEAGASPTLRDLLLEENAVGLDFSTGGRDSIGMGGAIYCGAACFPTVERVTLRSNRSGALRPTGGAVYVAATGAAQFVDCAFENNEAVPAGGDYAPDPLGGAIFVAGMATLTATTCTFKHNTAYGLNGKFCYGKGAAVYGDGASTIELHNCAVEDNRSCGHVLYFDSAAALTIDRCEVLSNDGGIALVDCDQVTITRSEFLENHSVVGGGLYIVGGSCRVSDSEFRGNLVEHFIVGGAGGGLYADRASIELERCWFAGNSAVGRGGAVRASRSTLSIRESTIAGNGADDGGGVNLQDSNLLLESSVLWGNCEGGGAANPSDLDVDSPSNASAICSLVRPAGVTGTLHAYGPFVGGDPLFCDPTPCEGRPSMLGSPEVAATSPCVPTNNPCCTWIGVGRLCAGSPSLTSTDCTPTGACCYGDGICVASRGEVCTNSGGEFRPEAICDPNPCTGACCLSDGSCAQLIEARCRSASGLYVGAGTACSPGGCPQTGACCRPSSTCVEVTLEECVQSQGTFLGNATLCSSNPCGANAGGVLLVHSDPTIQYSIGTSYCGTLSLDSCEAAVSRSDSPDPGVVHVFAAFPQNRVPSVTQIDFGVEYDASNLQLLAHGSCADVEQATPGWPASSTGTSVLWQTPKSSPLFEVYWFAAYAYPGSTARLALAPHPKGGAIFSTSDGVRDPILCLGAFGFGTDGVDCCPVDLGGACCFSDGTCHRLVRADCDRYGGAYLGDRTDCDHDRCVTSAVTTDSPVVPLFALRSSNPLIRAGGQGGLAFDLQASRPTRARVSLHSVGGQLIRQLVDEPIPAGLRTFRFDLDALNLPSGVYFLRAEAEGEGHVRKLVVIR
ncbi:MAG: right-handed parallel beta-helix repeat-containing protein [Candidatus Eisenbacteria bacterium]